MGLAKIVSAMLIVYPAENTKKFQVDSIGALANALAPLDLAARDFLQFYCSRGIFFDPLATTPGGGMT
jgi:hypothetical protein